MRIPAYGGRRKARIEIIPLIDVVFFLLATFMMVSLSMVQNRGLPVRLPAATSHVPQERGDAATITVDADGAIFFDREPVDEAALDARLEALVLASDDPRVFIQGDEEARYGAAIAVLDRVRRHGIGKVAIETRAARADPEP